MSDVFPAAGMRMRKANAPGAAFGTRSTSSWGRATSSLADRSRSRSPGIPGGQLQAGDIVATHSPGGQMR